ncbi:MAG: radical SAM protein [Syntrophus sp. (in: bacteria)]|nr:radical SAM protein [Syntrophus sp. (in: bacteria)]
MQASICTQRAVSDHPCFYGSAKARWGRVHLPVAPNCNIQCNFCNRLYDCANESRPAVTQGILEPGNVLTYLDLLLRRRSDISVVGIAGPGDPLCEPERTLEALRAVHSAYSDLLICISTNGLNLTEYIDDLVDVGVTHVTVTVNAVDPVIGQHIYSWVTMKNHTYEGIEAAKCLLSRQRESIVRLKARGLIVKINTVVLPGINVDHITAIAEEAARLGADLMNCIPMIPVPDTPFERLAVPADAEIKCIRDIASLHIPQMYHCRRCRADAVGLLCSDEGRVSLFDEKMPRQENNGYK